MRIWIYWNDGIARINVEEWASVELWQGGPTEEGYANHGEWYTLLDGIIRRETCDWGRDCDGRYEHSSVTFWPVTGSLVPCIDVLPDGTTTELPEMRPLWCESLAMARDFSAEAAGY